MDSSSDIGREEYNYQSGLRLNREQQLRRKLENKDYALKKRETQLGELQRERDGLEKSLSEVREEKSALSESMERQRASLDALHVKVAYLQKECAKEARKKRTAERGVAEHEEEARVLGVNLKYAEEKSRTLLEQLDSQNLRIVQGEHERHVLVQARGRLEKEVAARVVEISELRSHVRVMENSHSDVRSMTESQTSVILNKSKELAFSMEEVASLKQRIVELTQASNESCAVYASEMGEKEKLLKKGEQNLKMLNAQISQHATATEGFKRTISSLETENKVLKSQLHSLVVEYEERMSKVDTKEDIIRVNGALRGKVADLTSEVSALREEGRRRVIEIDELSSKVMSYESTIFLLTKSKHEEIELKNVYVDKYKKSYAKGVELQMSSTLLIASLKDIEHESKQVKHTRALLKAILDIIVRDNGRLRKALDECEGREGKQEDGDSVFEVNEAQLCVDALSEEVVASLAKAFLLVYGDKRRGRPTKPPDLKVEFTEGNLRMISPTSDESMHHFLHTTAVNTFLSQSSSRLHVDTSTYITEDVVPYLFTLLAGMYHTTSEMSRKVSASMQEMLEMAGREQALVVAARRASESMCVERALKHDALDKYCREIVRSSDARAAARADRGEDDEDASCASASVEGGAEGGLEIALPKAYLDDAALPSVLRVLLELPPDLPHSLPPSLAHNRPLMHRILLLDLSSNYLTSAACSLLAPIVLTSSSLRMLDLRMNRIAVDGRRLLLDALHRNESVLSVSEKLDQQMVEGQRCDNEASLKPLRIDMRLNDIAPIAPIADDGTTAVTTGTTAVTTGTTAVTTRKARPASASAIRRAADSSKRRTILSAKRIDRALFASTGFQGNIAGQYDDGEGEGEEERGREGEVEEVVQEHLRRLGLISALGTHNTHDSSVYNSSAHTRSREGLPRPSRPTSAPSVRLKNVYSSPPFSIEKPPATTTVNSPGAEPRSFSGRADVLVKGLKTSSKNSYKSPKITSGRPDKTIDKLRKMRRSSSGVDNMFDVELFDPLKAF